MCVPPLVFCLCYFPGVFLSSRVTGACPVTTALILQVDVRTTKTIHARSHSVGGYDKYSITEYNYIQVNNGRR